MEEWLTTGQVIDQIEIGDTFVCDGGGYYLRKSPTSKGIFFAITKEELEEGKGKLVTLNFFFCNLEWRLLPNYVSFEDAMKALKAGKVITWHKWNNENFILKFNRSTYFDLFTVNDISVDEFCEGKWTVEN